MKSRVLFIDHTAAIGGAELTLLDLAESYRDTSTVVLLAEGPLHDRLQERGVPVRILPANNALQGIRRETTGLNAKAGYEAFRLAMRMVPLARQHDCLHANSQKAFPIACLTGAIARRPVIWDLHDVLDGDQFSSFHIKLDVLLTNLCATSVLTNSHAVAAALIQQGGRAGKVHTQHNGVDAAPFDAVSYDEIADARAELGIADAPAIGLFGRLAQWKGQHVALEAMQRLPEAHLVIVGDALFGEAAYASNLQEQARALGVGDRVHFTGFRRDVPRLMRAVDLVLHTSTAPEPFGRVIVEGMLARRPVVATHGGGADEIIEEGVTGLLVRPGDPRELADAILGLFADPSRAWSMARAGRRAAVNHFSREAMVRGKSEQIERTVRQ